MIGWQENLNLSIDLGKLEPYKSERIQVIDYDSISERSYPKVGNQLEKQASASQENAKNRDRQRI